ncbi:MAG: hypothetical protein GXP63_02145 [DPANN group archaeon]|nr:hypothetical protein [DPANN group archaeon]
MDGAELCIRFAYITNKLRYCGPEKAQPAFHRYLLHRDNLPEVREDIRRFEGLYPYLDAIAKKAGKDFLDREVVEAYWLGNGLLDGFSDAEMKDVIRSLEARGLPASIARKRIDELPQGMFPHHDFNVFYVGVGNITQSVEATLPNMDNCRIGWGKVVEVVSKDTALVMTPALQKKKGKIAMGKEEPKTVVFLPEVTSVAEGDLVALHWGFIVMRLSREQQYRLQTYQERLLRQLGGPGNQPVA